MSYTNYRRRARRPMTNACPILIRHYSRVPADPAGTAPDRATCATLPPGAVAGSFARPAQTARVAQRGTLLIYLAVYNTSPLSCTVSPGAIKTACPSIAKVRKKNIIFSNILTQKIFLNSSFVLSPVMYKVFSASKQLEPISTAS